MVGCLDWRYSPLYSTLPGQKYCSTLVIMASKMFGALQFYRYVAKYTPYVPMYPMFSFKLGYLHACYVFRDCDRTYSQSERRGPLKFSRFVHYQHFGSICLPQHFFPGAIYDQNSLSATKHQLSNWKVYLVIAISSEQSYCNLKATENWKFAPFNVNW